MKQRARYAKTARPKSGSTILDHHGTHPEQGELSGAAFARLLSRERLPKMRLRRRVTSAGIQRSRYRWAVLVYDRLYRLLHGLDTAASEVGSAGRIAVRRSHRTLRLASGMTIRSGDRIGILHLNNAFIAALHADGIAPIAVGLEFRRQLVSSLHELARLAGPGGRLKDVKAFSATTIFFHQGLTRLGFTPADDASPWPRLLAAYQRALLASLHPAGPLRLRRSSYRRALRLWISRENLLARYGAVARPAQ